jgi:hypothetical protein
MPELAVLVKFLVGLADTILSIVFGIRKFTDEATDRALITNAALSAAYLEPNAAIPNTVAHEIQAAEDSINGNLAVDTAAVIAILNALTPVTLPTTPPSGYGGASVTGFWGASLVDPTAPFVTAYGIDVAMYQLNTLLGLALRRSTFDGWRRPDTPWFLFHAEYDVVGSSYLWGEFDDHLGNFGNNLADADPLTYAGGSIADWLHVRTGLVWVTNHFLLPATVASPIYPISTNVNDRVEWISCSPELLAVLALRAAELATPKAPIWPGVDGVTLGDAVALADRVVIDTPLDGVVVNVTAPPTGLGKFEVGSQSFWYRLGQLYFVTDRGDVEAAQPLGCGNAIYVPRTMNHAYGALLRVKGSPVGTVTPWTLT